MRCIILCAGFATRLYPLTRTVPKHLLPVAGRPVLDYVVERLGAIGIDQGVLVTNRTFLESFQRWAAEREGPLELQIVEDGPLLMITGSVPSAISSLAWIRATSGMISWSSTATICSRFLWMGRWTHFAAGATRSSYTTSAPRPKQPRWGSPFATRRAVYRLPREAVGTRHDGRLDRHLCLS